MLTEEIKKEKHCEILSIQVKFNEILIFAHSLENRKIKNKVQEKQNKVQEK